MRKAVPLALAAAATSLTAQASSHAEAPFIAQNSTVDATDLYMFRSYEAGRAGYVTILANYNPLQDAYAGPNFFALNPQALYEIHIDNNGDAVEDLTFQFRFTNTFRGITVNGATSGPAVNVAIPLINVGGITAANPTANLNRLETYTVSLVRGPRRGANVAAVTNAGGGGTTFTSRSTTSATSRSRTTPATSRRTSTTSTSRTARFRAACSSASAVKRSPSTSARSST